MLGVHRNVLDFEILETGNPKTLVFLDSSQYIDQPESPLLEVILPGYNKYFLINVAAKVLNTFNSSTIGINRVLDQSSLVDLPDGLWTYKYKICPYNFVYKIKKSFRITILVNKLKLLYQNVDLRECESKTDQNLQQSLIRIHILIEGIKAEANKNDKKAQDYYQLADKMIDKQLEKFCKNCK